MSEKVAIVQAAANEAENEALTIQNDDCNSVSTDDEPLIEHSKYWYCCTKKFNKQTTIKRIGYFLIFASMCSYISYLSARFFDSKINRKQYTEQSSVDSMPIPYIYFGLNTSLHPSNFSCGYVMFDKFDIIVSTINAFVPSVDPTVVEFLTWDSSFNHIANSKLGDLIDLNKWVVVHRIHHDQIEMLVIPPSDATLDVSNANVYQEEAGSGQTTVNDVGIRLYSICGFYIPNNNGSADIFRNESHYQNSVTIFNTSEEHKMKSFETIYQTMVLYDIDHVDQLRRHFYDKTLNDTFNSLSLTYDFIIGGHMAVFEYEWFSFRDSIDDDDDDNSGGDNDGDDNKSQRYDYFVSSIGSTFDILNFGTHEYATYGFYDSFFLIIKPNTAGIKVIYHTKLAQRWPDVLSDIGGMYGLVSGFINFVLIYLIWGVKIRKYYFPGLVGKHSAKPFEIETMKMKTIFKQEIQSYEKKIDDLNQTIQTLNETVQMLVSQNEAKSTS